MQEITIIIRFKTEHTPGSPDHLHEIARRYLEGKGVLLSDEGVIEV